MSQSTKKARLAPHDRCRPWQQRGRAWDTVGNKKASCHWARGRCSCEALPPALAGPFGRRSRQPVHAASSARPLAMHEAIPAKNAPHVRAAPTSTEAAVWTGAAPATARPMPAHSQMPAAMRGRGTARATGPRPTPCIPSRPSRRNRWRGPLRRARWRRPTAFLRVNQHLLPRFTISVTGTPGRFLPGTGTYSYSP